MAHVKILSDGFSSRRLDWKEEHTHIHIYMPSSPGGVERDAAKRNPPGTPILEEGENSEGKQNISSTSTQMPKDSLVGDKRNRRQRPLLSIRRSRRHRRSFQD